MKTLVLLLLFGFLSACSTIPEHSEPLVYSNSIPSVWTIAGQLSVMRNKKTDTVSFEFSQQSVLENTNPTQVSSTVLMLIK
jgi:starvation-inducible outer membrane lipoprotein